jgi:hypothetical protein
MSRGATHEAFAPRTFGERLHTLLGSSTWREPSDGARGDRPTIPRQHEVAAALGMARHMIGPAGNTHPDPHDVGPLVAEDLLFGQTRHASTVCRAVSAAMAGDRARCVSRNKVWLRLVCWCAYLELAGGMPFDHLKPGEVSEDDWQTLTDAARRIFATLAEDAVHRARGKWRAR